MNKINAIEEIVKILETHKIKLNEIQEYLDIDSNLDEADKSLKLGTSIITKVLSYIGGILIFSGIAIFIESNWKDMTPLARVIITLGTGFTAYLIAVAFCKDAKFERFATPLFIISGFLQPLGIFVMLQEYSKGGNELHGILFMASFMLIQQLLTYFALNRTVLLSTSLIFGSIVFGTICDLIDWSSEEEIVFIYGISMLCITYAIDKTRDRDITPFWYFISSFAFLGGGRVLFDNSGGDIIFAGLAAFIVYLSTVLKSRTLLTMGTIALLFYIGEKFSNMLNGSSMLITMGFICIAVGVGAMKINQKFIKAE